MSKMLTAVFDTEEVLVQSLLSTRQALNLAGPGLRQLVVAPYQDSKTSVSGPALTVMLFIGLAALASEAGYGSRIIHLMSVHKYEPPLKENHEPYQAE